MLTYFKFPVPTSMSAMAFGTIRSLEERMYKCTYIHYMYIDVFIYIYIRTHVRTYIHTHIIYIFICTCIYAFTDVCMCMYLCFYTCVYTNACYRRAGSRLKDAQKMVLATIDPIGSYASLHYHSSWTKSTIEPEAIRHSPLKLHCAGT